MGEIAKDGNEMVLKEIIQLLTVLLMVSVFGYVLSVLKEKMSLKSNTIVIDKKNLTQEQIDQAEIKTFLVDGEVIRAGDEIRLFMKERCKLEGVVLGARKKDDEILIYTDKDELKKCKLENIRRVKVVSKYGMFFKAF
ncbi:hypothetical protein EUAN_11850 [Andreesenia angusta]|uniref:Uncharacterized protein n=1 Tax=Andreesenia angusta TaxID=39480 RepID=A0A1S1V887_9FIRM|nr:hypothetical protein [Andreesenia angusta]OHW62620.1 hypothetical protein EUAN_11850 [Andreesenia angusta]